MQSSKGAAASLNALKKDSENFLKFHHGNGYRSSWYRSSLEQFTSMTFEQYIRVNVLGVPLPGFISEEPFVEEEEEEEEEGETTYSNTNDTNTPVVIARVQKTRDERKSNIQKNQRTKLKLSIDPFKYSDGIAKVTPPKGWWIPSYLDDDEIKTVSPNDDVHPSHHEGPPPLRTFTDCDVSDPVSSGMRPSSEEGLHLNTRNDDMSASVNVLTDGPSWEEGTSLGDMLIPTPIKQCITGIGGVYEFTMLELPSMTVAKYRALAEKYKKEQFGLRSSSGCKVEDEESDEHLDDLARFFWRRLGPTMGPSIYGADMPGTLFREDAACGWNVAKLDTCLQLLRADRLGEANILGVTSPYLYFGMWASTFAAHVEDMNLLSINYLHAGAPKFWYSITAEDTERFETLMSSYFSDASGSCSEFLRHKRYLLSPAILNKAGITYTTQVQRAGDFIITFPGCYHFGFNTGFNVAESTNFAVPEWIPIGEKANVCLCHPDSVRINIPMFSSLYDHYQKDDGKNMSYIDYAKAEQRRRADMATSPFRICKSETVIQSQGFIVDVYKMFSDDQNKVDAKKRKRRRTGGSDRRLARTSGKASFVEGTPVICLLPSSNKELKYFSGVVEKRLERNLRIHFDGVTRKKDIWIQVDSKNLFLDCGLA